MIAMINAPAASDTLLSRVNTALEASPHIPAKKVRIEAADGAVRMEGNVRTFFEKQMAQEVVRRLDGVERVENLIEVSWL